MWTDLNHKLVQSLSWQLPNKGHFIPVVFAVMLLVLESINVFILTPYQYVFFFVLFFFQLFDMQTFCFGLSKGQILQTSSGKCAVIYRLILFLIALCLYLDFGRTKKNTLHWRSCSVSLIFCLLNHYRAVPFRGGHKVRLFPHMLQWSR